MKTKRTKRSDTNTKRRSDGGDQALGLPPEGVSADESPTIKAAKRAAKIPHA